jgi:hypothetical protein
MGIRVFGWHWQAARITRFSRFQRVGGQPVRHRARLGTGWPPIRVNLADSIPFGGRQWHPHRTTLDN